MNSAVDGGELLQCKIQVVTGVGGGDLHANARLALGNHRIKETYDVDPQLQQPSRHLLRQSGVTEHDRYDRMAAPFDLEADLGDPLAKMSSILVQLFAQVARRADEVQRLYGGGDDAGGDRVGKEVWARPLPQEVDDRLPSAAVAAAGATERFSQRAGYQVDALHDIAVFVSARVRPLP